MIKMMKRVAMCREWFEEIKSEVAHEDVYFYEMEGREFVEVDVDYDKFVNVSTAYGWM